MEEVKPPPDQCFPRLAPGLTYPLYLRRQHSSAARCGLGDRDSSRRSAETLVTIGAVPPPLEWRQWTPRVPTWTAVDARYECDRVPVRVQPAVWGSDGFRKARGRFAPGVSAGGLLAEGHSSTICASLKRCATDYSAPTPRASLIRMRLRRGWRSGASSSLVATRLDDPTRSHPISLTIPPIRLHRNREFRETARHLRQFPRAGRMAPEFEDGGVREKIVHGWRMIYRFEDDVVTIAAIVHSCQSFETGLGRVTRT
jgi:plasmid stabilization system protein ParE